MNNFYKSAGRRIRNIREKSKLTREYIAMKADISPKFLYEIETGIKGFSADTLFRISEALGISTDYIIKGTEVPNEFKEFGDLLYLFSDEQKKDIIKVFQIFGRLYGIK